MPQQKKLKKQSKTQMPLCLNHSTKKRLLRRKMRSMLVLDKLRLPKVKKRINRTIKLTLRRI
jgi:hypothetical protein